MARDIKLIQTNGKWDIDFENGDFALTDSLDTALYMSVLMDKRASDSQVSEPTLRRGHFTNEFNAIEDYQRGSYLWLYTEQSKNIDETLNLVQADLINSLDWMIEDGIISEVKAEISRSNTTISIEIELINRFNQESKYYNLFKNL